MGAPGGALEKAKKVTLPSRAPHLFCHDGGGGGGADYAARRELTRVKCAEDMYHEL